MNLPLNTWQQPTGSCSFGSLREWILKQTERATSHNWILIFIIFHEMSQKVAMSILFKLINFDYLRGGPQLSFSLMIIVDWP